MNKKLLGRMGGTLIFQCEQDLNLTIRSNRSMICPNCEVIER